MESKDCIKSRIKHIQLYVNLNLPYFHFPLYLKGTWLWQTLQVKEKKGVVNGYDFSILWIKLKEMNRQGIKIGL